MPSLSPNHTRVYLRICRWCNCSFYSEQNNTLYCSYKHKYNALLESRKKYSRKYYRQKRKQLILKLKGTTDLKEIDKTPATYLGVAIPGSEWINEMEYVKKLKNSTFSRTYSKGKQKDPSPQGEGYSPYHNHVTLDDLEKFSISYLKEKNVKCPECGNTINEITHGLVICRSCGMVLKAPPVHPGFKVDDLVPKWKLAPTVQDLTLAKKNKKKAFNLAKTHYWNQVGVLDPEPDPIQEYPSLEDVDSQEDWRAAWKYYFKSMLSGGKGTP